jgi:hypothetical protein
MRGAGAVFEKLMNKFRAPAPVLDSPAFDMAGTLVSQPDHPPSGEMETFFWANDKRAIHKWLQYLPVYERYFAPFRQSDVKMLEIGVQSGGSAQMWRSYFGPSATIFGIDIDPSCARYDGENAQIRIGSQNDPAFLLNVIEEMGGVDIILDDGSHVMDDIRISFETLFPKLSVGGIYMVEDLHTAYWPDFAGGYRKPDSFIEIAKTIVDDIHAPYHTHGKQVKTTADWVTGVHFHDSIIVLDKQKAPSPKHAITGTELSEALQADLETSDGH